MSHILINKPIASEVNLKNWYAIYTFFRSEKKVVEYLNVKGIEAYVPLIPKIKRYRRKIKKYEVPLINNYVFVKIDKNQINKVLETEQVIKFIKTGSKIVTIPQYEIDILKKIEGNNIDVEVNNCCYEIGDDVEIAYGNLVGLKGKLVTIKGKNKFTVELEHLGLALRIEVDIKTITKIPQMKRVIA